MDEFDNNDHNFNAENPGEFPPKPVMVEQKKNTVTRSLISLLIYGIMFYVIFNHNIAYIAAILVVILIHESGHFLFMKLFDYSNVKIFIVPLLGAFTQGKKQQVSQLQLSIIILAGPVPGIIIGSLIYYFNFSLQNETLKMLANSFLIINLLNCLPFYPLDGGRLIETLFFKQNHVLRLVFGIISIIALCLLLLYNPIMLIIPVLIGLELYNENKHQKIRDYLKQEKIDYHLDYNSLTDKNYWLVRDCLLFSFPKKYPGIPPGEYRYSFAESLIVQHINALLQINLVNDLNIFKRIIILLIYIAVMLSPFIFFRISL